LTTLLPLALLNTRAILHFWLNVFVYTCNVVVCYEQIVSETSTYTMAQTYPFSQTTAVVSSNRCSESNA